ARRRRPHREPVAIGAHVVRQVALAIVTGDALVLEDAPPAGGPLGVVAERERRWLLLSQQVLDAPDTLPVERLARGAVAERRSNDDLADRRVQAVPVQRRVVVSGVEIPRGLDVRVAYGVVGRQLQHA